MKTVVLIEPGKNGIKKSSHASIDAALQCTTSIDCLITGKHLNEAAQVAARIKGVNAVFVSEHSAYHHGNAVNISKLILSEFSNYDYFISAATGFGKNIMPRVAAKLNVGQLSDISKIIDSNTFKRPIYAGNVIATVKSTDPKKVLTIRSTCFESITDQQPPSTIIKLDAIFDNANTTFVSKHTSPSDQPKLGSADIVVSGGRGFGNSDNFNSLLTPLAAKLNAAIGASRAAVDAGFISNDHQVGQTGKVVAPNVYFAIGISGAIQHLAGMSDSKLIIAINKDPNANIHQIADYSLIGDLFNILPDLTHKI